MAPPAGPKRRRADHRTRQTALKHETFAWAATFYPDDPERVLALAGYKSSLAAYRRIIDSPRVKKRMQDLKERVLCDGWRQGAGAVIEEPTKDAVIKKLWEFATAPNPPAASQVTALNALAKHYGLSVGVEDEKAGAGNDEDRPPPLHKRIEANKFAAAVNSAESDVIDHRLDDGLRVVAQQQLQNCDVRSIEAGRLCQALQPPRREVRLGLRPRRALVPQGLLKDAPFAPGKLIVRIDVRSIQAGAKPPAGEGYALLVLHHPFSQRIRRPIAVTEPRSGIGEVGDDQMAFVIGCHGSLRVWGLERI